MLVDEGWADRIHERKFRLLVPPGLAGGAAGGPAVEPVPLEDPDDHGTPVDEVLTGAATGEAGGLALGGAAWGAWVPLTQAVQRATRGPGVYLARVDDDIVYVGMAGERRGQGVRGRLTIYARGRGAVSGLGEAVLDRALGDPDWFAEQLDRLRTLGPTRAKGWAAVAFDRQPLDVACTPAGSAEDARDWCLAPTETRLPRA